MTGIQQHEGLQVVAATYRTSLSYFAQVMSPVRKKRPTLKAINTDRGKGSDTKDLNFMPTHYLWLCGRYKAVPVNAERLRHARKTNSDLTPRRKMSISNTSLKGSTISAFARATDYGVSSSSDMKV